MNLPLPHPANADLPPAVVAVHLGAPVPGFRMRGLDLGDDHYLAFSHGYEMPDDEAVGATVIHRRVDGTWCEGWIGFVAGFGDFIWTVESWDPLTCSPLFTCHCGDTGHITSGRWARA